MKSDDLDQRPDLRLGATQEDRAAVSTQTAGQHGQVKHQRRISEDEAGEVDDDIALRANRARQRPAAAPLRAPVLVALAAESRRFVIEVDDLRNLAKSQLCAQARRADFLNWSQNGLC